MELDKEYKTLLKGLEDNSALDEKRKIVNSMRPWDKYKLMSRFLSDESLASNLCLNYLPIFLDERTKFFKCVQITQNQSEIKSIFEIISKYCPNIKKLDFRNVYIDSQNKENFKHFLKISKQIKSLCLKCRLSDCCAIYQILLQEDFDLQDRDVQMGLQKIEYINGWFLTTSECITLLKLLPNLKGLGMWQEFGSILYSYIDYDYDLNRLMNITEFCDRFTNLKTLELLVKYCPNVTRISLEFPEECVIENLFKFSLLTDICIYSRHFDEIMNLIEIMGRRIKKLHIISDEFHINPSIIHELCPKLISFQISDEIYRGPRH